MSLFDKLSKFLPFSRKDEQPEYYFALNIDQEVLEASVWGIHKKRLHIISTATKKYQSEEDLKEASNYVLDEALADFSPEPSKILFGVPDTWLIDEDLKPEYLKTLRELVKELDVTPMAYVSITHAVAHLLQKLEGVPTTAILINLADPLVVTVVKGGKIIGSKQQRRTGNLPDDIEKCLLTFNDVEVLPSKILIYGSPSGGLDKFKQELLGYSWMSSLPFLHLPRVDCLDPDIALKAISFAGASEIDPDIGLHPADLEVSDGTEAAHKVSHPIPMEHKKSEELEDMGFVAGDIEKKESRVKSLESREEAEGDFEDGGLYPERELAVRGGRVPMPMDEEYPETVSHEPRSLVESVKAIALAPFGVLKGGAGGVGSIFSLRILLIPVLIVILLGFAAVFLPKAHVTVFVDPKTLEKEATVIADPGQSTVDEANKRIPGKTVETDISGSSKGSATGKKQVGDPARGSVIVYNKTSSSKSLPAGTILTGPNNLTFKLDTSVNVASQSAVEGGISFGKATANVTAAAIGPDGNLPAGKDLSIKGQSDSEVSAKVDTAFSGGVSKDVTVVTSDDQKKLLAQLSGELRKQAADKVQEKLTGGQKILPEGLSEKISKQTFSKNVNDQASDFTLNLTINYKGTAYNDADLKTIVSKLVETNVPEGFTLDLSKTETQAEVSKVDKDGKLYFTAKFRAKLMPKLDTDKIRNQIAFKTPAEVDVILKGYENVIGGEVKINPTLPGFLARLPILAKNITVEISSK